MTDNTQELDEIIREMRYRVLEDNGLTVNGLTTIEQETKQAITDWHNKQVEEAMAKFHLKKDVKYDVKASDSVIVITHTNNLQDSSND